MHDANDKMFDLGSISAEMRSEGVYEREGHTARSLARQTDLRILLIVMKAGAVIKEHRAKQTATVHVVSGRVRLQLADGAVDLASGRLFVIEPGLPHSVEALEPSDFVLTLGWRDHA